MSDKNNIKNEIDYNNEYFKTRYAFNEGRVKVWKAIAEYLGQYIPQNATVLDLGAGYCDFINQVSCKNKIAIDINQTSKEYADKGVLFINKSILDVSEAELSNKVDVVFASNFLEHFSVPENIEILNKIKAILNDNGKLILLQPNYYYAYRNYWDDYTHKTAFTHASLSDLVSEVGFKVINVQKKFVPFSFKSKLPTSYFLTKMYLKSPIRPMAKQMLLVAGK